MPHPFFRHNTFFFLLPADVALKIDSVSPAVFECPEFEKIISQVLTLGLEPVTVPRSPELEKLFEQEALTFQQYLERVAINSAEVNIFTRPEVFVAAAIEKIKSAVKAKTAPPLASRNDLADRIARQSLLSVPMIFSFGEREEGVKCTVETTDDSYIVSLVNPDQARLFLKEVAQKIDDDFTMGAFFEEEISTRSFDRGRRLADWAIERAKNNLETLFMVAEKALIERAIKKNVSRKRSIETTECSTEGSIKGSVECSVETKVPESASKKVKTNDN